MDGDNGFCVGGDGCCGVVIGTFSMWLLPMVFWNGFRFVEGFLWFLLVVQIEVLAAMVDLTAMRGSVMVVGALRTLAMGLATDFLLVAHFIYLFGRCRLLQW